MKKYFRYLYIFSNKFKGDWEKKLKDYVRWCIRVSNVDLSKLIFFLYFDSFKIGRNMISRLHGVSTHVNLLLSYYYFFINI